MKRGQVSLDLIFAITLVSLTVLGLVSLSTHEAQGARAFDTAAQIKAFSIDIRDTVNKVYSSGPGFSVKKSSPFPLNGGDSLTVVLNASSDSVRIDATVGGKHYFTVQRLQVPLASNSSVTLTPSSETLWVVAVYNETAGMVDVEVKGSP